jgi:hypothetical protein
VVLVNAGFTFTDYKYRLHQTQLSSPMVPVTTEFDSKLVFWTINEKLPEVRYDPVIIFSQAEHVNSQAILNSVI